MTATRIPQPGELFGISEQFIGTFAGPRCFTFGPQPGAAKDGHGSNFV